MSKECSIFASSFIESTFLGLQSTFSKIPAGELAQKWSNHKAAIKVVSPANKRKLDIIVVGTGLGGASAAASLGELGYNVKVFWTRIQKICN